jgi:hypothetical protein
VTPGGFWRSIPGRGWQGKGAKIGKPYLAPCAPPGTYPPARSTPGDEMHWHCHGATYAELVSNLQSNGPIQSEVDATWTKSEVDAILSVNHQLYAFCHSLGENWILGLLMNWCHLCCRSRHSEVAGGCQCHVSGRPEDFCANCQQRLQRRGTSHRIWSHNLRPSHGKIQRFQVFESSNFQFILQRRIVGVPVWIELNLQQWHSGY